MGIEGWFRPWEPKPEEREFWWLCNGESLTIAAISAIRGGDIVVMMGVIGIRTWQAVEAEGWRKVQRIELPRSL